MADRQFLEQLMRDLTDKGRLIEAGWISFRILAVKSNEPVVLAAMRVAFMAGAQHLFGSMFDILEDGEEATDDDLRRMDLIAAELAIFTAEMEKILGRKMDS